MRKIKPAINPVYDGKFTRPVNRDARGILSTKRKTKDKTKKASPASQSRRSARIRRTIEEQRQFATEYLQRLAKDRDDSE